MSQKNWKTLIGGIGFGIGTAVVIQLARIVYKKYSTPKQNRKALMSEMKVDLSKSQPKYGIFVNSASPVIAGQLSHLGYDWLLVDFQHGPMSHRKMGAMIAAIHNGKAKVMVRVGGYNDRPGIQQALDLGADGILVPYINTKEEAEEAVSCCLYPTQGTRSVYFPQASTNERGLLGAVGDAKKCLLVAIQVETASCIQHIDEIVSISGVDLAFLGQNDLAMSMGLYEKYVFPEMYVSKELNTATEKMLNVCVKYQKIPGIFLFGTERVAEFLKKGFRFIAIGNDLHHLLTQAGAHVKNLQSISEKAERPWKPQPSAMIS